MSVEYVLMIKTQQVCLFKMPPLSTSKGYFLDDWKEMFWEGGCKLTELNETLYLHFINKNTQAVENTVKLPPQPFDAIQKTIDSTRGYAVRLVLPNGAFQWVGCVFRDRNDAFDFNAKILDWMETKEREKNPSKFSHEFKPTQDFSLKQGEKLNLGGDGKKTIQPQANLASFKFDAPPDFSDFSQGAKQQPQKQQATTDWGDFGNFGATKQQPQQTQQLNNVFPSWGQPQQQQSWQPQQTQQQQQQQKQSGNTNQVNLLDL